MATAAPIAQGIIRNGFVRKLLSAKNPSPLRSVSQEVLQAEEREAKVPPRETGVVLGPAIPCSYLDTAIAGGNVLDPRSNGKTPNARQQIEIHIRSPPPTTSPDPRAEAALDDRCKRQRADVAPEENKLSLSNQQTAVPTKVGAPEPSSSSPPPAKKPKSGTAVVGAPEVGNGFSALSSFASPPPPPPVPLPARPQQSEADFLAETFIPDEVNLDNVGLLDTLPMDLDPQLFDGCDLSIEFPEPLPAGPFDVPAVSPVATLPAPPPQGFPKSAAKPHAKPRAAANGCSAHSPQSQVMSPPPPESSSGPQSRVQPQEQRLLQPQRQRQALKGQHQQRGQQALKGQHQQQGQQTLQPQRQQQGQPTRQTQRQQQEQQALQAQRQQQEQQVLQAQRQQQEQQALQAQRQQQEQQALQAQRQQQEQQALQAQRQQQEQQALQAQRQQQEQQALQTQHQQQEQQIPPGSRESQPQPEVIPAGATGQPPVPLGIPPTRMSIADVNVAEMCDFNHFRALCTQRMSECTSDARRASDSLGYTFPGPALATAHTVVHGMFDCVMGGLEHWMPLGEPQSTSSPYNFGQGGNDRRWIAIARGCMEMYFTWQLRFLIYARGELPLSSLVQYVGTTLPGARRCENTDGPFSCFGRAFASVARGYERCPALEMFLQQQVSRTHPAGSLECRCRMPPYCQPCQAWKAAHKMAKNFVSGFRPLCCVKCGMCGKYYCAYSHRFVKVAESPVSARASGHGR